MTFQTFQKDANNRYKKVPKGLENKLCSIWLGRQDSNLRMTAPKTVALPLGHAPSDVRIIAKITV
jgi:hypothetical protein